MTDGVGPAAEGVRVAWGAVPDDVRAAVDHACGSPVTRATTQRGGFSPGLAARVECADGRRFFVKAVSGEANARSRQAHLREAVVLAGLQAYGDEVGRAIPVPRLHGTVDDGTWVALVLDDVGGRHPHLPWRHDELEVVVAGLDELARLLTPAPIAAPPVGDDYAEDFAGWRRLAAGGPDADGLDAWSRAHLERLAEVEASWTAHAQGPTLLHTDLRGDNLLLTPDGLVVVDWPGACVGAPLVDLVCLAPSVAMQGGPEPAALLRMSAVGAAADHEAVAAVACAVAGYFTWQARQPPPSGLPTVRAFQAAQGVVARRWVADLFEIGPPAR